MAGSESQSIFATCGDLDGQTEKIFSDREQFIGLTVQNEEFLLPIAMISEIIMLQNITYVPHSPPLLEGVINLRGKIVPVINLRRVLHSSRGQVSPATRLIITENHGNSMGIIVDSITNVISLLPSEIENETLPGKSIGSDIVGRIGKSKNRVTGILDVAQLVIIATTTKKQQLADPLITDELNL